MIDPSDLHSRQRVSESDSGHQRSAMSPSIDEESSDGGDVQLRHLREQVKLLHASIEDDLIGDQDRMLLRSWMQVADAFLADGAVEETEAAILQVRQTLGKKILRAHRGNTLRRDR